ncbi:MAG: hypothetical protein ACOH2R_11950 [Pseudomonas sp.]
MFFLPSLILCAPKNGVAGVQKIGPESERSLALSDRDTKLDASGTDNVLRHLAWPC